jgi:hypothetical protein
MAEVKNYLTYQRLVKVLALNTGQDERRNHWIKFEAMDDGLIKVVHQSFVSAGHQSVRLELQQKWKLDAISDISNRIKKIEDDYKELSEKLGKAEPVSKQEYTEAAKEKIKLKFLENTIQETSEPLSSSLYNVQRTSVYKVYALIKVD